MRILLAGALCAGMLGGCAAPVQVTAPEEYPDEAGGHISNSDPEAAKDTGSDELVSFYLSYYDGAEGNFLYEVKPDEEGDGFILIRGLYSGTSAEFTGADMEGLQKLVREYSLAELNGIDEETMGLPAVDGDFEIRAEYASGESIRGRSNGGFAGVQREGFDAVRDYLERILVRSGDAGRLALLYRPGEIFFSAPGEAAGLADCGSVSAWLRPYDGWAVQVTVSDSAGNISRSGYRLDSGGFGALYGRILVRAGAGNLTGIQFLNGEESGRKSFDVIRFGFDPESGEQVPKYSIDLKKEVLVLFDYKAGGDGEVNSLLASGVPDAALSALAEAAADELLNLGAEKEFYGHLAEICFVSDAPEHREKDSFSYFARRQPDGSWRLDGRAYPGAESDAMEGKDLLISEDRWEETVSALYGWGLTRKQEDSLPVSAGEPDGGNTLTMVLDDGTELVRTLGAEEKRKLGDEFYYLLRDALN